MQDTVTASFNKKRARGDIVMSPMSHTTEYVKTSEDAFQVGPHPIWGTREYKGNWVAYWSNPISDPGWYAGRVNDASAYSMTEAYSNIAQSSATLLVTMAEARKTAAMLSHPFEQSRILIGKIMARKAQMIRKGLLFADAATRAWLEYRLGWKPLLYDIENIMKAAQESAKKIDPKPIRLVARSQVRVAHKERRAYSSAVPHWNSKEMVCEIDLQTIIRSGVLYELSDANANAAWQRTWGLRLADVPGAIWELVPLSFVVDRFLNVGQWIESITPKPGVTVLGNWQTVERIRSYEHEFVRGEIYIGNVPFTTYRASGGFYHFRDKNKSRSVNLSMPALPSLVPKELSLVQHLDHIALITQNLLGLGGRSRGRMNHNL